VIILQQDVTVLSAESLGKELGMYTDPLQYFGSLFGDIWRLAVVRARGRSRSLDRTTENLVIASVAKQSRDCFALRARNDCVARFIDNKEHFIA
jgi:hypothetical protein